MIERLTAESVLNAGRESFLPSRPLPSMTFAVDWWRGNGSPKAFQQTNVAIHAASSLVIFALLFTVLLRTGHSESIAGLAAFIAA
ncbi:MAG: tetratricopeptide repeat protein, partial [Gammaproteobacteria bacterium]|nr:tetratricopeptide repeat protein [Gammaproteobacteria bacterium]